MKNILTKLHIFLAGIITKNGTIKCVTKLQNTSYTIEIMYTNNYIFNFNSLQIVNNNNIIDIEYNDIINFISVCNDNIKIKTTDGEIVSMRKNDNNKEFIIEKNNNIVKISFEEFYTILDKTAKYLIHATKCNKLYRYGASINNFINKIYYNIVYSYTKGLLNIRSNLNDTRLKYNDNDYNIYIEIKDKALIIITYNGLIRLNMCVTQEELLDIILSMYYSDKYINIKHNLYNTIISDNDNPSNNIILNRHKLISNLLKAKLIYNYNYIIYNKNLNGLLFNKSFITNIRKITNNILKK